MKIKDLILPLILIPVGLGFLAVCLMLFIKHDNRKLVAAKMRLGAILLGFSWITACTTPPPPEVTCYKPALPDNQVYFENQDGFAAGDTLKASVHKLTYKVLAYEIIRIPDGLIVASGPIDTVAGKAFIAADRLYIATDASLPEGAYEVSFLGKNTEGEGYTTLTSKTFKISLK